MNNEIKEIINDLQRVADRKCYPEDILCGSIAQEWVDYITNLQEENKELNDSVIWWTNRFNAVERDNRKLKADLEMYENGVYFSSQVDELEKKYDRMKENAETLSKGYDDLQARIDKAIEYIKNNKLCICKEDEGMMFTAFVDEELLNILQGSDKE